MPVQLSPQDTVGPSCGALTFFEGSKLIQLLMSIDALSQPKVIHLTGFYLGLIHRHHGGVVTFPQLWVTTAPLAT
jgi:hypothetical protein